MAKKKKKKNGKSNGNVGGKADCLLYTSDAAD